MVKIEDTTRCNDCPLTKKCYLRIAELQHQCSIYRDVAKEMEKVMKKNTAETHVEFQSDLSEDALKG